MIVYSVMGEDDCADLWRIGRDGDALVCVQVTRENLADLSPGLWFVSLQEE